MREHADVLQRLLVQPHAHAPAFEADGLAAGGADTHRVDADAALGRHLGGVERVGARGALAIGQHDDGGRVVAARGHGREGRLVGLPDVPAVLACTAGEVALAGDVLDLDAVVREQRGQAQDDAAAGGGAALQLEAVDRGDHIVAAGGGRLHHRGGTGEGHHAHLHLPRQVVHEGLGRLLRGHEPVGLDVLGAHAAGHVHRQHDGALGQRQRDGGGGARHRKEPGRDGAQHQQRRHVAAPARAAAQSQPGHLHAGQAHGGAALLAQQPQVQQHQQRQQGQQPEHRRPDESHGSLTETAGRAAGARGPGAPTSAGRAGVAGPTGAAATAPGRRRWPVPPRRRPSVPGRR